MRIKDLLLPANLAALAPEFVSAGAIANSGTGTTITILNTPMPEFLEAGNLLIAVFTNRTINITNGIDGPNSSGLVGWTQLGVYSSPTAGEFGLLDVWYKISTGGETVIPYVTYLNSSSNIKIARVYQFRNVGGIVATGFNSGKYQAGTISPINLTTTVRKSLAVSFMMGITNGTLATYAGATGGTWTEPVAEYTTSLQNGSRLGMNIAAMPTPGTISGGSMSGSTSNVSFSFILTPKTNSKAAPYTDPGAPRFINKGAAVFRVGPGSVSPAYPGSITAGNLLIMTCVSRSGSTSTSGNVTSPPTGFTFLGQQHGFGANYQTISIYYKLATGSEAGTQAVSMNAAGSYACGAQIYQFTASTIASFTAATGADLTGIITQPAITGTRAHLVVIFTSIAFGITNAGNWSAISGGQGTNGIAADALAASTTATGLGLAWQMSLGTPNGSLTGTCSIGPGSGPCLTLGFRLAA